MLTACRGIDIPGNRTSRSGCVGPDIEIEDSSWDGDGTTGVRYIDDAADAALDGCRTQDHVGLFACVTEFLQVFHSIQARSPVRNGGIEIVLITRVLIHGNAFEDQVIRVVRFDRARPENRVGNPVFLDTPLMRSTPMSIQPAISIAPQNVISPSP